VGQQDAPGKTEEAETATGAVNSDWPGCRPTGPPHLHLRRQYGCAIERCFEDEKGELGLDHYEGRKYRGLKRHLILTAVSHLFLATAHQELRGEKPGADGVPGADGDVGGGEGVVAVGPVWGSAA
jgi:hypothetical protein